MSLSSEDQLRLQVMLHNNPLAIRIDENAMVLHGLTPNGEANIPLSPNCSNDSYLKLVKETLSTHILGSPGGYPVYLKRWSRMGQTGDAHLNEFLLLGEPEAVVAVANSPGLTLELAERVWWAVTNTAQQPELGRYLLRRECVIENPLGKEIAHFLVEHLPFLAEPNEILDLLAAVLQKGLLPEEQIEKIWQRSQGRGKSLYQIAFLHVRPLELPDSNLSATHPELEKWETQLQPLAEAKNLLAKLLLKTWSAPGQTFLNHVQTLFDKLANEESAYAFLHALGNFFADAKLETLGTRDLEELKRKTDKWIIDQKFEPVNELLKQIPELKPQLHAMLFLAQISEKQAFEFLLHSGAVGASLRRKLEPLKTAVLEQLSKL